MLSTSKMRDIEDFFEQKLVLRATAVRENKPKYEKPCKSHPVILHSYSDSGGYPPSPIPQASGPPGVPLSSF